jgi:hypothetical protein
MEMTIKQYTDIAGVSAPTVSYRMKNRLVLPGIKDYRKVNRVYVLVRDETISDDQIRLFFRTTKQPFQEDERTNWIANHLAS